ncbi:efflux RND transporter periplasmic adaptor subunit [Microbulbifer sp. ARAS458-1]|uniref:efflux RND transporter periplasmic adaptor subunit n=1 Tax=Microbulbifer sp. ARAS458-1 TaxID=3140242 RepID=UPI00387836DE
MSDRHQSVQEMLAQSGNRHGFFTGLKSRWKSASITRRNKIGLGVVGAAAVAYWGWSSFFSAGGTPQFSTATIGRGNLEVSVTATGNLQPVNQVDIGTEVSGTVETVSVDYNDQVKKGQELARLVTVQWQDQVRKSSAALASSKASLQQAEASQIEAAQNVKRLLDLREATDGRLPSRAELEAAEAADRRARADVAVAEANVESASADLASAETNLAKAIIVSPVDGVVLSRVVEPGQTVAASLSAPVLFTLAEDLSKMELEVSVDEADIGKMSKGLNATFSVDAWPGREYPATVTRVSLGSSIVDNVVSYSTLLSVDNPDQTLRPGMTATATITTESRENVLLVPNVALRFTPPAELMPDMSPRGEQGGEGAGGRRGENGERPRREGMGARTRGDGERQRSGNNQPGGVFSQLISGPPRGFRGSRDRNQRRTSSVMSNRGPQRVWVMENGELKPVRVRTGISDGRYTEIIGGRLEEGAEVITGMTGARG